MWKALTGIATQFIFDVNIGICHFNKVNYKTCLLLPFKCLLLNFVMIGYNSKISVLQSIYFWPLILWVEEIYI